LAKHLKVMPAGIALQAGIHHAAHPDKVSFFKTLYISAHFHNPSDNFMTWHYRIGGVQPFVTGGVYIAVAYPAVGDLNMHIILAGAPPRNIHFTQGGVCRRSAKCSYAKTHFLFVVLQF
jgi:hypothetical protein